MTLPTKVEAESVNTPTTVEYLSSSAIPSSPLGLAAICNIVTPVGMLGYGLHEDQTAPALVEKLRNGAPTAIVLDSGSTDSGPEKLALGCMSQPRDSYVRDLKKLVRLVWNFRVPLIFSSAGGDGSDDHVRELTEVVKEIASSGGNKHYRLKTISIFSGIHKKLVSDRLKEDVIVGCGKSVSELTQTKIDVTPTIMAQMGPEPILDAMLSNPDFNVLVAGRAYDPAPYIAYVAFASKTNLEYTASLEAQRLWGGFSHMGKILECGGLCGVPKSNGAMATVYDDGTFDVTPLDPDSQCTPVSVAAHTLYEKSRPDILHGPGGWLDLSDMKTVALQDWRSVKVSGGMFHFSKDEGLPYNIKLEGAQFIGYRSQMMGSFKDPILINQLDSFLERIKEYVKLQHNDTDGTWDLDFHVYGKHQNPIPPSEVFIIGEALASTQQLATSVVSVARIAATHGPYSDQKATSGNLAFGLGGRMHIELGACARFSIYHLMQLKAGEERLKLDFESPGLFTQEVAILCAPDPVLPMTTIKRSAAADQRVKTRKAHTSGISVHPVNRLNPKTLGDVSRFLRSKNSGPYEITLDLMFDLEAEYKLVKESKILNTALMAELFEMREEDIIWAGFFDQALAFKVTIPRRRNGKPTASGGYMENDVHGSQSYIGLLNLELPNGLIHKWNKLQQLES